MTSRIHVINMPLRTFSVVICILILSCLINGCATGKDAMLPDEDSLRSTAECYWNARIDGDYNTAYTIEDREDLPDFGDYRLAAGSVRKPKVRDFSIDKIDIEGTRAALTLKLSVHLPASPKPFKSIIRDSWIYKNGAWRHLFTE